MNTLLYKVSEKNSDVAETLELVRLFRMDHLLIRRCLIEESARINCILRMKESHEEGCFYS